MEEGRRVEGNNEEGRVKEKKSDIYKKIFDLHNRMCYTKVRRIKVKNTEKEKEKGGRGRERNVNMKIFHPIIIVKRYKHRSIYKRI